MMELRWYFTVVILAVGVANAQSYWIQYPPTLHLTRFVSFLCSRSVVTMWTYMAFLCDIVSLWYTKKIVFVHLFSSDTSSLSLACIYCDLCVCDMRYQWLSHPWSLCRGC